MKRKLAIVGSGISGLGCAYFLHPYFDISVFEQNDYAGGHTNTITVSGPEATPIPIDTGFMVYNNVTYPNLTRLFNELNVCVRDTDMSFSVQHRPDNIEWCGSGLNYLFAQRRNLFRWRYWKMLMNLNRFNQDAVSQLDNPMSDTETVLEFVRRHRYGNDFLNWFLIPMSSAIWSTSPEKMLAFPVRTLLRFFHTHGFLGMDCHLQWKTVVGGSQTYRDKIIAPFKNKLYLNRKVSRVYRQHEKVSLAFEAHESESFDTVIFACHADQALALLESPTPSERNALNHFAYEKNIATLHTDATVMPKRRLCWASWNYRIDATTKTNSMGQPATHYWMNSLQGIPGPINYFVSINAHDVIDSAQVLRRIEYEHPIFTVPAIAAQSGALPNLNHQGTNQSVYFCGSYFKYGFHEDAFTSALNLSRLITGMPLWQ